MVSFIIFEQDSNPNPIIPHSWGFVGRLNPDLCDIPDWCQPNDIWICSYEYRLAFISLESLFTKYEKNGLYWIYTPQAQLKILYKLPLQQIHAQVDSYFKTRDEEVSFLERCLDAS